MIHTDDIFKSAWYDTLLLCMVPAQSALRVSKHRVLQGLQVAGRSRRLKFDLFEKGLIAVVQYMYDMPVQCSRFKILLVVRKPNIRKYDYRNMIH